MTDDPIVEEVHAARARILAEFGGDVQRYAESLLKRRDGSGPRISSPDQLRDAPVSYTPDTRESQP